MYNYFENGMQNNSVLNEEQIEDIQIAFLNKVFGYMSFALILTAVVAFIVAHTPTLLYSLYRNPFLIYGLFGCELLLVGFLSRRVYKMNPATALMMFIVYSIINGMTLSYVFVVYTGNSVSSAFFITAITFLTMSFVGFKTKADLTKFSSLFTMALLGIILASLCNIFLQSTSLMWIISYVGIFVFIGLIAYDTQKLKHMSLIAYQNGGVATNLAIVGALALYLDFINIFLFILRIFGDRD